MDAEHRVIAELLALKDAPDDVLLDQVRAIGVPSTHHICATRRGDCGMPICRRRRTVPPWPTASTR